MKPATMVRPAPLPTEMEPGHDGNPVVVAPLRDIDGVGKRELIGFRRTYTLRWLYEHGKIDQAQWDAGNKLMRDAEAATIGQGTGTGAMTPGSGVYIGLSDGKCDALQRSINARRSLDKVMGLFGAPAARFLTLFLIDQPGITLEKAGALMGWDRKGVLDNLKNLLDIIAKHYHFA